MTQTRVARRIRAPRAAVYRALIHPITVAAWRVPDGMTAVVHTFDANVGGGFRVSLTYDWPNNQGKTDAQTDTYHGHFETADPALRGVMRMTTTLTDAEGGTDVVVEHEGIPAGVSADDNVIGTTTSLDKLAALVEPG